MHTDVLVIGGGIHGAGIAQAAAAAGHAVRVLEQYPALAQGTSSRSSKLIHGGLRYLERGDLRLVHECLVERRRLLDNAPELVRLQPFHIPVYHATTRPRWQLRLGLALYTMLGGGSAAAVPRREWGQLDGLNTEGLLAVYRYFDAQTDDARLTRAVMQSAMQMGTELELGANVQHIHLDGDAAVVSYREASGRERQCRARVVVNAGGPWAGSVLSRVSPTQTVPAVDLVAGTHIRLPGRLDRGIYYVESPRDRRPVFVMPWGADTLIGTTERIYRDAPDTVTPSDAEIAYLLDTHSAYFPQHRSDRTQLLDAFAGLRVLPRSGKDANARSRETVITRDRERQPRLLSVFGGKLTAYRATADRVMKIAASSLPGQTPRGDTRRLRLTPAE